MPQKGNVNIWQQYSGQNASRAFRSMETDEEKSRDRCTNSNTELTVTLSALLWYLSWSWYRVWFSSLQSLLLSAMVFPLRLKSKNRETEQEREREGELQQLHQIQAVAISVWVWRLLGFSMFRPCQGSCQHSQSRERSTAQVFSSGAVWKVLQLQPLFNSAASDFHIFLCDCSPRLMHLQAAETHYAGESKLRI